MGGKADQQHFEALWREHRGIVLKVASVYAYGAEERDDLVQEIGAQLWRSFDGYDGRRAKFSTWLYRIALNVAISQSRRRRSAPEQRFEPLQMHHLETIGGGEGIAEADERLVELYAFVGTLDPLNRALILLYLEDRSYTEIAEVLGISETNVATKLGRIRQKWRGQMTAAAATGA
ncbi:RNA polymerase subunit sigma-70 [Rhodanobacter thiooxydans]|uniref:RNA polymerase subunit sigma-70 n=1 Tax=Rhodanobacter thiooxydans TaxID=416169 RepID=A0A154QHD6_9GAMM|nr:sigma-70 family RNA polymerase sigma factor [Rhodanobacter thiooxydans]EIM01754.1 RNA polymerase ECF-type sigma factor [Rhodanobacter thiooxydans LCS2]KZC23587.1 RNA polymerase subunit sigma-70 [Rhodanobacter thiooxydans]MCW0201065.1 sigma-70 family RNA polymerase sigma factor [Rhodanobacter thiooxydans]